MHGHPVTDIISALTSDSTASWEAFVRVAQEPVWAVSLRAAPRRPQAEQLFSHVMARLHDDRLTLPSRWLASGLGNIQAFLVREIDEYLGQWLVELFRGQAREAPEVLVRLFHADIKSWVQRATPIEARSEIEDCVQDVYAAMLEGSGKRLVGYVGGGSFRGFLRSITVNLMADAARQLHGRRRPKAAYARLSPLEQRAYQLIYEGRLTKAEAVRRLGDSMAEQAVQAVLELGDLGATHVGDRPRLVAIDDGVRQIDLPDEGANPEDMLLHLEETISRNERESQVLTALRALPAEHRRILEARFLEGLKPGEIAETTGMDIKDIYRILERSLVHLKKNLVKPS